MIILKISAEPVPRAERICRRFLVDMRAKEKKRIGQEIEAQYGGPLIDTAVNVTYRFFLTIPKNVSKVLKADMLCGRVRPTKRPDCSNLIKLIEDVMTERIYVDDRLIVEGAFSKWWAEEGFSIITIEALPLA